MSEKNTNRRDENAPFVYDAVSGRLTASSAKRTLVQGSHECEVISFLFPRFIDGRDLSLCNRAEVHYVNSASGGRRSEDVYLANDLHIEGEHIAFSWLVRNTATEHVGRLSFSVHLKCIDGSGRVTYECPTAAYDRISIIKSENCASSALAKTPDLIASLRAEALAAADGAMASASSSASEARLSASAARLSASSADTARDEALAARSGAFASEANAGSYESSAREAAAGAMAAERGAEDAREAAEAAEESAAEASELAKRAEALAEASYRNASSSAEAAIEAKKAALGYKGEAEESACSAESARDEAVAARDEAVLLASEIMKLAVGECAAGGFISVCDSADSPLRDLKIEAEAPLKAGGKVRITGKNMLPYPYKSGTSSLQGLDFTVDPDGCVIINGTAEADVTWTIHDDLSSCFAAADDRPFYISGCPRGGGIDGYALFNISTGHAIINREDRPSVSSETNAGGFRKNHMNRIGIKIKKGTVCDNLCFKPMITAKQWDEPFEKYSANEIALPCDLNEGDVYFPIEGRVLRADGSEEIFEPVAGLSTSKGVTNVLQISEEGTGRVHMEYTADTKLYIDRKLAEMMAGDM